MNGGFLVLLLVGVLIYMLLIRPQRRRQAQQSELISSVEVGDEIVTAGGLYGHVREIGDEELVVEIAPGTNVRIARRAVAGVFEPDEDEEDEEPEEAQAEPAAEAGEGPAALEKPR